MKEKKICPYLQVAREVDGSNVDVNQPCLNEIFRRSSRTTAARGICPRCSAFLTKGKFKGSSAGSLTDVTSARNETK